MRAVVGRPSKLTVTIADGDGNPTQVDVGTEVTVDVRDGTATPVVTGDVASDDPVPGVYTYALAPRAELDDFTVTWHATVGGVAQVQTDVLRIVGNRILRP